MAPDFSAVRVSEHVYWVGAIDRDLRDFHGYATPRGTTYNAYLIDAGVPTLIDTVKAPFREELLARISSVMDPQKIRVIISNHSELDHSGCLPELIEQIKPEKVVASAMGVKALADHFRLTGITAVKDGERLSLGNVNVTFTETRMLHWPDSMFTFVEEDRLLFSQDAFGMHVASAERFADELDDGILDYEAAKYFANILQPYAARAGKLLEKIAAWPIPPAIIAPDHGPIWRRDLNFIVERYAKWAVRRPQTKAVIVYDTMWQSTAKMAAAIGEGLAEKNISVKIMPLAECHRSDVATELLDAAALLVGSPTLNDQLFPTIADVLTYLRGLQPKGLIGATFGSYGWSSGALDELKKILTDMHVELIGDSLKVKYVPDAAALEACRTLGRTVADEINTRIVE